MTRPIFARGMGTSPAGPAGPAGAASTVPGPPGAAGSQGPQGLPGVNAVANDTATASYINTPSSATATALGAYLDEHGGGGGGTSRTDILVPASFNRVGLSAGRKAQLIGTRDFKYVEVGDSTTYGYASNHTGSVADWPLSQMAVLGAGSATLAPIGEGMVLPINSANSYNDARWVFGTGWSRPANQGEGAQASSGASGVLQFTPGYAADSVTVEYAQNGSMGSYVVKINGSTVGTIAASGSNLTRTVTYTFTRTTNPVVTIDGPTGGSAFVFGIGVSDSTARAIRLSNQGHPAAKVADFVDNSFPSYSGQVDALVGDVVGINLTVNDTATGTPIATWRTGITTLIDRYQTAGSSVALIVGLPSSESISGIVATQEAFAQSLKKLAVAYGCAWLDLRAGVGGTYAAGLSSGYFQVGDQLHPTVAGYAKGAQQRLDLLAAMLGG